MPLSVIGHDAPFAPVTKVNLIAPHAGIFNFGSLRRRNKLRIVRCKSKIYSLLALLFLLIPKKARYATTFLGALH